MRLRNLIAPLIVLLGFCSVFIANASTRSTNDKDYLAQWTQYVSKNRDMGYAYTPADTNDLGVILDEVIHGRGQKQLGSQYVAVAHEGSSGPGCDLGDCPSSMRLCGDHPWAVTVYKDILAKDKFLALRAGYKPSLTGCKPAIITAVTVEFEGGQ